MTPRIARALFSVLIYAAPIAVCAFEVGEFKSGMAQERVLQMLRTQGFKITQQSPTSFFAQRESEFHSLGFCNSRLTFFSSGVPGGIRGFIRRVTQISNQYGQGDLGSLSSETNVGEINSLSVTWLLGPDTLRVTYFAQSERSAESQSVAWFTRSECRDRMQ